MSLDEVLPAFDEDGRHFLPMDDWSTRVNDPAVQRELRIALTAAIENLPASYRIVLALRDVEELSNAEIAEQLSLHLPTVKTRVHRARLLLRNRLGDAVMASPRGQVRAPLDSRARDELIDQAKTTVFATRDEITVRRSRVSTVASPFLPRSSFWRGRGHRPCSRGSPHFGTGLRRMTS